MIHQIDLICFKPVFLINIFYFIKLVLNTSVRTYQTILAEISAVDRIAPASAVCVVLSGHAFISNVCVIIIVSSVDIYYFRLSLAVIQPHYYTFIVFLNCICTLAEICRHLLFDLILTQRFGINPHICIFIFPVTRTHMFRFKDDAKRLITFSDLPCDRFFIRTCQLYAITINTHICAVNHCCQMMPFADPI